MGSSRARVDEVRARCGRSGWAFGSGQEYRGQGVDDAGDGVGGARGDDGGDGLVRGVSRAEAEHGRAWLVLSASPSLLQLTRRADIFSYDFVSHLFTLVERTRDAEDETFNYGLIKLIIALNEQFMVSSIPVTSHHGHGTLAPPILPTIVGKRKEERDPNLVLEVLKRRNGESKTFGENIIFILNRASESGRRRFDRSGAKRFAHPDGSPDSLCVSLLILKILYLLFTTSGTEEYFYTNDLCVLVDVFLRELSDLGEESEGVGARFFSRWLVR